MKSWLIMKSLFIVLAFYIVQSQTDSSEELLEYMLSCFTDHGINATHSRFIMQQENWKDILKNISEEKLACITACMYHKFKPGSPPIHSTLISLVNDDKQLTDNQRKELLDTLNNCKTQAAGDECKLLNCIKVLKPPFSRIIFTEDDMSDIA